MSFIDINRNSPSQLYMVIYLYQQIFCSILIYFCDWSVMNCSSISIFYHILVLYLTEFILICSMMKISHDLFYLFDSRVCRDLFWHKFVVIYYLNHGKKYMDHDFFFCSSHLLHIFLTAVCPILWAAPAILWTSSTLSALTAIKYADLSFPQSMYALIYI